jgi:hypothetical protein
MIKGLINKRIYLIFLFILLFLSSCGPSVEEMEATETKIAAEVYGTQTAAASKTTNTPLPSPTSTATNTPTPTQNKTATAVAQATTQAQSMANLIQELYSDGYLQSTQGEYFPIFDFEESFAQINWINTYFTDTYLSDFVLRSNIAWKTAKEGANIRYSGCGFWFGIDEKSENFHEVMLALDGNVRLNRCLNDCSYMEPLASSYFGKIDYMEGEVEVILINEGGTIQYFVNGEKIFSRPNQKKLTGDLGYAISSGTNAGFGTRCSFTNTEIWSLEP